MPGAAGVSSCASLPSSLGTQLCRPNPCPAPARAKKPEKVIYDVLAMIRLSINWLKLALPPLAEDPV